MGSLCLARQKPSGGVFLSVLATAVGACLVGLGCKIVALVGSAAMSGDPLPLPTIGVSIADSTVFYFSGKTAFLSENIETKNLRVIVTAFSSAL